MASHSSHNSDLNQGLSSTKKVTSQQARTHTVELSLDQLIACQYWTREKIPLPNKKTKAHLVGGHLSPFKGRGMEFAEVRQYQPGDDIRTIDWRVTARTGKTHTKIFQEERERPIFLVVDLQDSMFFGSTKRFKSTLACLQASRAFWTAFNGGNRVAALVNTADDHIELKPSNKRKDGLRLLQQTKELHNARLSKLYAAQSGENTPFVQRPEAFTETLQRLRHLVKGGSLIYLFSDFHHLGEEAQRQLTLLSQHNDVYGVMMTDPLERSIPIAGELLATDGVDHHVFDSNNPNNVQRYQQQFDQHLAKVQQIFKDTQCFFTQCSTADDIIDLSINPMRANRMNTAKQASGGTGRA